MTKYITRISTVMFLVAVSIVVFAMFFGTVFAQQGSGSGGSAGAGEQDRDRLQDPTLFDGSKQQDQIRDQDKVNQQDNATGTQGVGDQDRLRTQDQDRLQDPDQLSDQDRLRDQDRIHQLDSIGTGTDGNQMQNRNLEQIRATTSAGLGQYIQEQVRLQNQLQTEDMEDKVQLRNKSQIAVRTIQVAEDMLGQNGARLSQRAIDVDNTTQVMLQQEAALQERSWLRTFFFGQDKVTAQIIKQDAEQNRVRIQEMNQLLLDCGDCEQPVKEIIQEQLQAMLQEQERLNQVADEAMNKNGILGWLFGN